MRNFPHKLKFCDKIRYNSGKFYHHKQRFGTLERQIKEKIQRSFTTFKSTWPSWIQWSLSFKRCKAECTQIILNSVTNWILITV